MTQEDKQLLLVDLCARLPYKVIVDYGYNAFDVHKGHYIKHGSKCILNCYLLDTFLSPRQNEKGEYIKPYLRPMSSMTEEEKRELQSFFPGSFGGQWLNLDEGFIDIYECESTTRLYLYDATGLTEWLNKKMFDYRGLIPEGLALSTDVFNPYKH